MRIRPNIRNEDKKIDDSIHTHAHGRAHATHPHTHTRTKYQLNVLTFFLRGGECRRARLRGVGRRHTDAVHVSAGRVPRTGARPRLTVQQAELVVDGTLTKRTLLCVRRQVP